MSYDLFITYSRQDNQHGRITDFVRQVKEDYKNFASEELRCFIDIEDIQGMEDWKHRILEGLRDSQLLLVCLSPAYLEREYCAWEFNEYLKYEPGRAILGQGVAPVYFVEIPGWEDPGFEKKVDEWVSELRKRQHIDLRPWFTDGISALRNLAVRQRMEELNKQIHDRLLHFKRILDMPGNVERPNERFVGRIEEMRRLHEMVGLGRVGVLTAVHGLGGIGKTALAIQYAHVYADYYAGGRWQIHCEGRQDLRSAIVSLAGARGLEFEFTEEQKRDIDAQFSRTLAELRRRTLEASPGRCLIILDNVDDPGLLEPAIISHLPREDWLHIIATSRLGDRELFGSQPDRCFLPVDELSEDEAFTLIERYQPNKKFANESDQAAAREIVKLLGCLTLAVESAAVFLGSFAEEVTCRAFLERLKKEGLISLESLQDQVSERVRHGEMRISATLRPTLEKLSASEILVLIYASLLPADCIALTWIRALASEQFPELGKEAEVGYPDPWQNLLRHLFSLRLLQCTGTDADKKPREARMHRLIQEVIQTSQDRFVKRFLNIKQIEELRIHLLEYAKGRMAFLEQGWLDWTNRWEIEPLWKLSSQMLLKEEADGTWMANSITVILFNLGRYLEAESLMHLALAIDEKRFGPNHPEVAIYLSNFAVLLKETDRFTEAEPLMRRALSIDENSFGPDHPNVAIRLNNFAMLFFETGHTIEAESMMNRALKIDENNFGSEDCRVARDLRNLATILSAIERLNDAERLIKRSLAIAEKTFGENDPIVAVRLNILADLFEKTNRPEEAELLRYRILSIDEINFGVDHPKVVQRLISLSKLLRSIGRHLEAEPVIKRAFAIFEKRPGQYQNDVASCLNELALLFYDTKRFVETEPLYRRALNIAENIYGRDHRCISNILNNLALLLQATKQLTDAELLFYRAISIDEKVLAEYDPDLAIHLNNLAKLLQSVNKFDKAEPLMKKQLYIFLHFYVKNRLQSPSFKESYY